jgi:hypothetical protein
MILKNSASSSGKPLWIGESQTIESQLLTESDRAGLLREAILEIVIDTINRSTARALEPAQNEETGISDDLFTGLIVGSKRKREPLQFP